MLYSMFVDKKKQMFGHWISWSHHMDVPDWAAAAPDGTVLPISAETAWKQRGSLGDDGLDGLANLLKWLDAKKGDDRWVVIYSYKYIMYKSLKG